MRNQKKPLTDERENDTLKVQDGRAICPVCGCRMPQRILPNTRAYNWPLYCKRCKQTTVVSIERA